MSTAPQDILQDLDERGLIQDTTDRSELAELLSSPTVLYHGIDPSANSLHVGNFIGVLALRRFQDFGHRPLVLVGGATGMVGDPSGKSDERNLLDTETLEANMAGIRGQLERFIDFGDEAATMVNNHDWTAPVSYLEFLRDVGKHMTVNQMTAKDSVKSRLASETGISYTEFSYMLLQAFDFNWLYDNMDCKLQVGGSDQWGNITAGIDLVRRRSQGQAHGLTWPLFTKADGTKFGKSQEGNVWLDPERTSPYAFYQFWINTDDRDLEGSLLQLTLLSKSEVDAEMAEHAANPGARSAHRRLANEVTTLVHGAQQAAVAAEASQILFGGAASSSAAFEALIDEIPTLHIGADQLVGEGALVPILTGSELAKSNGEARRSLEQGAIYINGGRRSEDSIDRSDLQFERFCLLRKGKRNYCLAVVTP